MTGRLGRLRAAFFGPRAGAGEPGAAPSWEGRGRRIGGFLFAAAAFGIALYGRFALSPYLPPTGFPFLTFFPAVILTTLVGGLGPGLLVSALSTAAAAYFFIPPVGTFVPATNADLIALVFFACILLVDCAVIHVMKVSLARVRSERARGVRLVQDQQALATELAARLGDLRAALDAEARIRASLAESEGRLRAVTDTARVGLVVLERDADGRGHRYRYANPAYAAITAVAEDGIVGRPLAGDLGDCYVAVLAPRVERAFAGERQSFELTLAQRGGERRVVRCEVTLDRNVDPAGHPIVVAVVVDVTQRWQAETALQRLNEGLEARVQQEVAARQAAQTRAAHAERVQALGQLASGIAHDFNNVLQVADGAARVIEGQAGNVERVRSLARRIVGATERGSSVTRRLLAFAHRSELRAERVETAALLRDLREMLVPTLGGATAVRIEHAPSLPPLLADKGQLETVVVNLATNARDAMPAGGTLTLAAMAEILPADAPHPAGLRPGPYVRLSVADTGIGMDEATLARVTEPFFTTKPAGRGTGLGLSLAKGFAEQSGGGMLIESAPGQGTTVTLWLPQAAGEAADAVPHEAAAPTAAGASARSVRVLLVDDDEMVRETLAAQLEEAGHIVLVVGDGETALAAIEAGEPVDLLITDLSMPGLDGIGLIRGAQARRPGLPAILLTGHIGEAAHPPERADLAYARLGKPVSAELLSERIAEVLAGARPRLGSGLRV